MDVVGSLVKAILREQPLELLTANRKYLEFAAQVLSLDDDEFQTKALVAVLNCTFELKKVPNNIDSVLAYVRANPRLYSGFEKSEQFDQQLTAIKNDDDTSDDLVSAHVLIDIVYNRAYQSQVSAIFKTASKIATGSMKNPHTKETGPEAAKEYIQEEQTKLVTRDAAEVGGELTDNIDHVQEYINRFISGDSKRIYTGFKRIDEVSLIGRKQSLRWIGILGYTHHGKSLFLSSLLYNMVSHGAKVMLIPRETSVEDAWMSFVWLHHKKICPERPIASKAEWMREGANVGIEKYNTIQFILDDLKNNKTLDGRFHVHPCKTWEEVEDKLTLLNPKEQFDVLAIDYFGHLETDSGNKRDTDVDKLKKALRKAQMLSQHGVDHDQSGLVIITPLQANKKGHDAAAARADDLYGIYESMGAVEYYTQAAQDMDLVLSVWLEGDHCTASDPQQMLIHCLKARANQKFPTHYLAIDPHTGRLSDPEDLRLQMSRDTTANGLSEADTAEVLYTKTSINSEEWEDDK